MYVPSTRATKRLDRQDYLLCREIVSAHATDWHSAAPNALDLQRHCTAMPLSRRWLTILTDRVRRSAFDRLFNLVSNKNTQQTSNQQEDREEEARRPKKGRNTPHSKQGREGKQRKTFCLGHGDFSTVAPGARKDRTGPSSQAGMIFEDQVEPLP